MRAVVLLCLIGGAAQASGYDCRVTRACVTQYLCEGGAADCTASETCGPVDYVWGLTLEPAGNGRWTALDDPEGTVTELTRLGDDPLPLTLMAPATGDGASAMMLTVLPDLRLFISLHSGEAPGGAETVFGTCEAVK